MSKNLFTFSVIATKLAERLLEARPNSSCSQEHHGIVCKAERILVSSLTKEPDSIAFYRCIMDGWNQTHRELRRWVKKRRPQSCSRWDEFIDSGLLLVGTSDDFLVHLLPRPSNSEIKRYFGHAQLGYYAISAFVWALYDAVEFQVATSTTTLVLMARCLGPSMDDSEYYRVPTENSIRDKK